MALPLKKQGLLELRALRARVQRQHAMARIDRKDYEAINEHLDIIEARIIRMTERNEQGEEL